jgi:hypothetical protein
MSDPALPPVPLTARRPIAQMFRRRGAHTLADAARLVESLPYGRNTDRADPRLVLIEGRGTCSTKHALLWLLAQEHELEVALVLGFYEMAEINTPGVGRVLAVHGLAAIPEAHCVLHHGGRDIDLTMPWAAKPGAPITLLRREAIAAVQIGDYKRARHRQFLREWLEKQPPPRMSLEAAWSIREACISALQHNGAGGR